MSNLFEGDFHGKAIKAEYGTDKGGKPQVRVMLEITTEGERKGTRVPYSGNFKAESIKYTKRDLLALGWAGKTISTFVADVMVAPKVVPFQVRIADWTDPETGKRKQWLTAGSIGYEVPPLNAATNDMTKNVDSWFAELDAPGNSDDLPF